MEEKKRTVTKVQSSRKAASEAAEEVKATGKKVEGMTKAEEKSKATTLRIVSAILWLVAIACEVLAILVVFRALRLPGLEKARIWWILGFIVVDFICCVIAGLLWKKASHLDPFSGKNKFLFFILSQLGAIMAAVCLLPLIIIVLTRKEDKLDKKTKTIVTVVACILLAIACLLGIDFHPLTAEQKADAAQQLSSFEKVYWTRYGHKYHLYEKCQAIRNSTDISYSEGEEIDGEYVPAVRVAMDNGCTGLCAFCARDAEKEGKDLKGIVLEDGTIAGADETANDLTVAPEE
ncbi:MAG: hypothetical protein II117_01360 [Clostridia bacterium]|nr:hypothetical protein [Clostridia bacterium]